MRGSCALVLVVLAASAGCGPGSPPSSVPDSGATSCAYDAGIPMDAELPAGWMTSCDGVGLCVLDGEHGWLATYAHGACVSGRCVLEDPPVWTYCENGCVNGRTAYARCAHAGPTAP
jgi:hypothetical protein